MPEFGYALICEYVRVDANVAHIVGANVDTLIAPHVPTGDNFGVLVAVVFTPDEQETQLPFEVVFRSHEEADRIVQVAGVVYPTVRPDIPEDWPQYELIGLNLGLYFPSHGRYVIEVFLDGQLEKALNLRAVPPPPQS